MSSTLTDLTAATTWSGTDLFYALVGGNSRKIAASSFLVGEATDVLSAVRSTNAQIFRVYRTFTDSSNYERLALDTTVSQELRIKCETAGTGTDDIWLRLMPSGSGVVKADGGAQCSAATVIGQGVGYHLGTGGSVTQTTNKATTVTIHKMTGKITTTADSLAANTAVKFNVQCNLIQTGDCILINHASSGSFGTYRVEADNVVNANGFDVTILNFSGGALAESLVINYVIIKGQSA